MNRLEGKVVIVTGSTSGIGIGIARLCAKEGAKVVICGRREEKGLAVVNRIAEEGGEAWFHKMDITSTESIESLFADVKEHFGKIDVLVNNAGITRDNLFLRMNSADWNAVINTNLTGVYNVSKPVVKLMMKQRSGNIINMSSIVGVMGNAGQANYSAAKAGLIGMTKSLAKELASRNIRVNAIAPGFINTDMTKGLDPEKFAEHIPLKRLGEPEDIAKTAKFLAVDGTYITGQVIGVDGGLVV